MIRIFFEADAAAGGAAAVGADVAEITEGIGYYAIYVLLLYQ